MLERAVSVVQALALALVVVAVVLLFTNEPTSPPPAAAGTDVPTTAADLFGQRCAGCHGGDGSGGIGPPLRSARVLERFPDAAAQIEVVTNGRGGMPAFGTRLTAEEIAAVVEYTRTSLG